jgi:hypothetical protein
MAQSSFAVFKEIAFFFFANKTSVFMKNCLLRYFYDYRPNLFSGFIVDTRTDF